MVDNLRIRRREALKIHSNRRTSMKRASFLPAFGAALALLLAGSAGAAIHIGATLLQTRPPASLGIPQNKTIALPPPPIPRGKNNMSGLGAGQDTPQSL